MNPERWRAIGELFDKAVSLPDGARTACVESESNHDVELRREVMSLIASHKATPGGFVQDKIKSAVLSFHELKVGDDETTHVGPYRLLRELGRGGMGTVFLAERDDDQYKATVAIKLVRPGMDTQFVLARFRRERQTLARLQHPNIARLLDGGTTESGLPYIVMEYVDGAPINAYAQEHKLDIPGRIRLFLDVCSAVDYAHRNFVVHRDLKPGNILVDAQGVPKLLDFGICKLLHADPVAGGETLTGLMTPSYASPEQIRGEAVALLSDIYSLGVVLYELLTGGRPYQLANLSPQEITRVISEGVIPLPSASVPDRGLSRQLAGDLDNIVMHALENEPQRRYESTALLAEDLQGYLLHEPVRARPQTAGYRAYKFLRRYSREVTAVCALFLVMLAGLAAAVRGQRQADARLAQVRELANKLVFDVHDSVQDLPGATKARQVIAQTAVTYLDSTKDAIKGDARAERELASAYRRLGDVQGNAVGSSLGDPKSALVSYRKALDLLENAGSRKPLDLTAQTERLVLYDRIGSLQMHTGKASDAVQILQTGISLGLPSVASADNSFKAALADLYIESGDVKRDSGDYPGSLRDATEALHLYQQIESSGTATNAMLQSLATAHAAVGMAEGQNGRLQDALKEYRDDAELMEKLVTSDPQNASLRRDLMLAYGHIADISGNPSLLNLGDRAAALQAYRKAAEIGKQLYDADPANERAGVDYGIVLSRIATVTDDRDWKAKAAAHTESLRVLKDVARHNPNDLQVQIYLAFGNLQLGETLRVAGELAAAEKAYTNAAAIADPARKSGQISFPTTFVLANLHLAQVSVAQGNRSLALEYAHRAYEASTNLPKGAISPLLAPRGLTAMGLTYAALARSPLRNSGDRDQAISWLRKSLESWKQAQQRMPGFSGPLVREMHEVETTLASLESR